ncbi:MAG TPA: chemotaxis protein CheB [Blastocatellia bacterium]|nr:chemotaxis protein CheB [Blastocatellia bacterium]
MLGHDIIVIGASAGGVEALTQLVRGLPEDLPASVFVVLHVPSNSTSVLAKILNRVGRLPAASAVDYEKIEPGRIYVAQSDCHLLVKRGHVRLTRGPKENTTRPAIDPLFRTAARYYGRRVVGVVLTGTLDDGTAGLLAIKSRGGIAVVQDPDDALYSGMPRSALENVAVDHCLPLAEIPAALARLANEQVEDEGESAVSDDMQQEIDIAEMELDELKDQGRPGVPSRYSCPECQGVLFEIDEEGLFRFRCRVGHAYSAETLLSEQAGELEAALWTALRSLEENVSLARRLADRMRARGNVLSAERFDERADDLQARVGVIRKVLLSQEPIIRKEREEVSDATAN